MTIPRVSLRQLATDTVRRAADSTDPLDQVTTTIRLREELVALERVQIRELRGSGVSWADIARRTADRDATMLFTRIAGMGPTTSWTCTACGNTVIDYGPEAFTHPDDQERGHGTNCPRHAADLTEYQRDPGPGE